MRLVVSAASEPECVWSTFRPAGSRFFSLTKGYENIVSIRIGKHETRRIPHVCVIVENNRVCSCGMPVSFLFREAHIGPTELGHDVEIMNYVPLYTCSFLKRPMDGLESRSLARNAVDMCPAGVLPRTLCGWVDEVRWPGVFYSNECSSLSLGLRPRSRPQYHSPRYLRCRDTARIAQTRQSPGRGSPGCLEAS